MYISDYRNSKRQQILSNATSIKIGTDNYKMYFFKVIIYGITHFILPQPETHIVLLRIIRGIMFISPQFHKNGPIGLIKQVY